jgi:lysophospholipid acyltransferase (LPLAT)-like uncharacterized protein
MLPLLYHHRDQGVAILISEHSDGEIIARIAASFGFRTIRGSTSRGAARALLGLARVLTDGRLTRDHSTDREVRRSHTPPGAAIVAQRTRVPVIGAGLGEVVVAAQDVGPVSHSASVRRRSRCVQRSSAHRGDRPA